MQPASGQNGPIKRNCAAASSTLRTLSDQVGIGPSGILSLMLYATFGGHNDDYIDTFIPQIYHKCL